ncbi:MAG: tetratricopeptide repeat protein [Dorea sp.]|jgi:tetratricopeptide (TPR) repeat protein|nr:tetratricopeptide repeat protein [Dorea sp.]
MKYIGRITAVFLMGFLLAGCQGNPAEKGVEYLEAGQYEEAAAAFEEAVEAGVNIGDAYRGIGIARWEQKDYEGAKEAFLDALENEAQLTGTLYNFIGSCELKLDNPVSAQNYFRLGIGTEGNSAEMEQEMKYNMIVAYEQAEDWESAKVELDKYISEYPDDGTAQKEREFLETR